MSGFSCPDCGAWFPGNHGQYYEGHRRMMHPVTPETLPVVEESPDPLLRAFEADGIIAPTNTDEATR